MRKEEIVIQGATPVPKQIVTEASRRLFVYIPIKYMIAVVIKTVLKT